MAFKNRRYPSIDKYRERMGIPKQVFADRLDLSWEAANKKLMGQTEFSLTEIMVIADWWGMGIDELVGHTVPTAPVYTLPAVEEGGAQ